VYVLPVPGRSGSPVLGALAHFVAVAPQGPTERFGECAVYQRRPIPERVANAGAIDVGGLVLRPDTNGRYPESLDPSGASTGPAWNPGATIRVAAVGAAVPAFTEEVELPADLIVSSPPRGPTPLSKAAGFATAWTPLPGRVVIQIAEVLRPTDGPADLLVECDVARGEGSFTIPPAALSLLSTTAREAGGPNTTISIFPRISHTQRVGAWDIESTAIGTPTTFDASDRIVP